jgi:ferredoxin like protein
MTGNEKIEDRLALLIYHIDKDPHIVVNKDICKNCGGRPCLICPAECYQFNAEDNKLIYNHEGCLECGTCRIVCPLDAVEWSYPKKGSGVTYRFG